MELTFNSTKREEWISQVFESTMKQIQDNMSNGVRITEIYLPREISTEVKDKIDGVIDGKGFGWMTVRRDTNPYTGKPQSFSGMVIGDEKYYKLQYYGN